MQLRPSDLKDEEGAVRRAALFVLKGKGVLTSFPLKRNRQARVLASLRAAPSLSILLHPHPLTLAARQG